MPESLGDVTRPTVSCKAERTAWQPIPLAPFELMMLMDDRPGYPKNCAAEFYFDGVIDRDAFSQAHRLTVNRHTLLHAIVGFVNGKKHWVPTQILPHLVWNHPQVQAEFAVPQPYDLTRELGHRTWVNVDQDRSVIRFDFHHAVCDAAGGMSFIEDVLVYYDAIMRDETPTLREFDDSRLMVRDQVEVPDQSLLFSTQRWFVDMTKSLRLLFTRAIPIPSSKRSAADEHPKQCDRRFITRHLSEADLVSLRYAASNDGVTLNDLVLVEFMCGLRDWIGIDQEKPSASPRDHVRVIVPMNLRGRDDIKLSSANKIGFSFTSRSLRDLALADSDHWLEVVEGVNAELKNARKLVLPARFLKKLALIAHVPMWFDYWFSTKHCWATAILTQIGDPTRRFRTRFKRTHGRIVVGDLVLSDFVSCGPLRPLSRGLLSINTYGNTMTLTFCWDPATIDRSAAEVFLDRMISRLTQRIQTSESETTNKE